MKTQDTNLFIVDDDKLMVSALQKFLQNRFGGSLKISTFNDGDSCIENVNKDTNIVILDYCMQGKNGLETLKSIKEINPKTQVIMLTGNGDVELAIESFKTGAKDYVQKGEDSWVSITNLVYNIITEPLRVLVEEFGISKYMGVFLLTFVSMAILVLLALHLMK